MPEYEPLSTARAADLLGISRKTTYRMATTGKPPLPVGWAVEIESRPGQANQPIYKFLVPRDDPRLNGRVPSHDPMSPEPPDEDRAADPPPDPPANPTAVPRQGPVGPDTDPGREIRLLVERFGDSREAIGRLTAERDVARAEIARLTEQLVTTTGERDADRAEISRLVTALAERTTRVALTEADLARERGALIRRWWVWIVLVALAVAVGAIARSAVTAL